MKTKIVTGIVLLIALLAISTITTGETPSECTKCHVNLQVHHNDITVPCTDCHVLPIVVLDCRECHTHVEHTGAPGQDPNKWEKRG